jgi:hypothetical protein
MSVTRLSTLSRQSTPSKNLKTESLSTLFQDIKTEKKRTETLSSRISNLERQNSSKFVTRSVTPLSSKLLAPYQPLDLSQVSRSSVTHKRPSSTQVKNARTVCQTDRKSPESFLPSRISPSLDSSLTTSEKNIENLRLELQQRRELIVGLKETVSRKQLEHKYWALVSEIEETTSRLLTLKQFNKELRLEIREINSGVDDLM